jgi:hypothetical protein
VKPADPALGTSDVVGAESYDQRGRWRAASLWNGTTRALLVVFGGLLTLQASNQLDAPKVAYLVAASAALCGSVVAVWQARLELSTIFLRPWLITSGVILGILAVSFPVALAHGSSATNWLRDASAYVLFAAAPWLAVDLARAASSRLILGGGLIAGLLGAASFVITWVQRRQLLDLPIDRLTLPSMTLGSGAYCIAVALAFRSHGWQRAAWILLSVAILGGFLVTGSRTTFVLLAAPAAAVLIDVWQRGRIKLATDVLPVAAQFAAIAIVLSVSFGGFPSLGSSSIGPSPNPSGPAGGSGISGSGEPPQPTPAASKRLEDRFSTLDDVVSGRDQSLQLRIEQSRVAWNEFVSSPLLGIGPGHVFSYMATATIEAQALTLDTPLMVVAKFGIFGLLMTGAIIAAFMHAVVSLVRRSGPAWPALILAGYGAVLLALIPFGWPLEDKGTGLALVFLLALAALKWRSPPKQT